MNLHISSSHHRNWNRKFLYFFVIFIQPMSLGPHKFPTGQTILQVQKVFNRTVGWIVGGRPHKIPTGQTILQVQKVFNRTVGWRKKNLRAVWNHQELNHPELHLKEQNYPKHHRKLHRQNQIAPPKSTTQNYASPKVSNRTVWKIE